MNILFSDGSLLLEDSPFPMLKDIDCTKYRVFDYYEVCQLAKLDYPARCKYLKDKVDHAERLYHLAADLKMSRSSFFRWAREHKQLNIVEDIIQHMDEKVADAMRSMMSPSSQQLFDDALCKGAEDNNISFVQILLDNGANLINNCINCSASKGHVEMVKFLIKQKAKFDDIAIIAATKNGHREIVQLLLDHGAKIGDIYHGRGLLGIAIDNSDLEMVRLLLSNGADDQYSGNTTYSRRYDDLRTSTHMFLEDAIIKGNLAIVELLLEHRRELEKNPRGRYLKDIKYSSKLIKLASIQGHIDIVQFLINNGFNIGDDSLRHASEKGYLEIVKILLAKGADVNHDFGIAFTLASSNGHVEIVKLLFDNGVNFDRFGYKALRWAIEYSQLEVIKFLLEKGVRVSEDVCRYYGSHDTIKFIHDWMAQSTN